MPNFKVNSFDRYNAISTSRLKIQHKPKRRVPTIIKSVTPPVKEKLVFDGEKWVFENEDGMLSVGSTTGKVGKASVYIGKETGIADTSNENVYLGFRAGTVKSGGSNTCLGHEAGKYSSGRQNTYLGNSTCSSTGSSGSYNLFMGSESGFRNTTGSGNVFGGAVAGSSNTDGNWNVFFGQSAGNSNETGSSNVFMGANAGISNINGSSNLCLGDGTDVSSEDAVNQIVIGANTIGYGNNTITFPDTLKTFPNGTEVNFSSPNGGCLYPVSSSRRWKQDIRPLSESIQSEFLYNLEPVTYRSKEGKVDDIHLGFIAEEVEKYFPQLVPKDKEGLPASVRYSLITVLLVEELKKLKMKVEKENLVQ